MPSFRVWAPHAKNVQVTCGGAVIDLERAGNGYWHTARAHVAAGSDYRFILDGGAPVPDPRSPWQPEGVHGPSRLVDHATFPWTDRHWQARPLVGAVIYELHIGTFTPEGTFDAASTRLDHLIELGITHVELMPVCEFSGRWGWGYDGVDLYAPHHVYGGPDGLKRLVNACHEKGLAVLLDVVYNHLGPSGNYLAQYGSYFTDAYQTPWGAAVNLDHAYSDEVRRFFCDSALMWLRDYHFDGLRLDAIHAYYDRSARPFLEQLVLEVEALEAHLGRHLVLIAESDLNDPRVVTPRSQGGLGVHAQWSDDFHHALHSLLTGERNGYYEDFGSLAQLAKVFTSVFVYDGIHSPHRKRAHGRPVQNLSGRHFLAYLQNHDQIGNRAQGDRSSRLMNVRKLKIGAALVLTSPFVPMLFQGEEWAASTPFQYFTDHEDQQLGEAVSAGRRSEFRAFGWEPEQVPDPQEQRTFEESKLKWDERHRGCHAEVLAWHRELIALRRSVSALTNPDLSLVATHYDEGEQWLVVDRQRALTAVNFAGRACRVPLPWTGELRLSSGHAALEGDAIVLEAESVAMLTR